jgi:hypothetical protein
MPHRFDTDGPVPAIRFRAAGALGLREAFRQAAARSTLLAKTDAGVPYADGRNAPRRRGREAEGGGLLNLFSGVLSRPTLSRNVLKSLAKVAS